MMQQERKKAEVFTSAFFVIHWNVKLKRETT